MSKPNYRDIARQAGVGTATVERVLNGRGGVRPELVEKVISAARRLNYPRKLPETHRGLLRIEALMVRPDTTFYRRLSHDIGYLSNELIENAVKFRQPGEILIEAGIFDGTFLIRVKNTIDGVTSSRFQQLLHRLQSRDPGELLLEQIETNAISAEGGSGLGLLTLLSDYDAKMA